MTLADETAVRHTVAFRLRHPIGSAEERDFLAAAAALKTIPGVTAFEVLRQVGRKNGYSYALSMEFADAAAYAAYDSHPEHQGFVADRWLPEVEEFVEIDYQAMPSV
jgi:heme-degrading monooxygenase HmoA